MTKKVSSVLIPLSFLALLFPLNLRAQGQCGEPGNTSVTNCKKVLSYLYMSDACGVCQIGHTVSENTPVVYNYEEVVACLAANKPDMKKVVVIQGSSKCAYSIGKKPDGSPDIKLIDDPTASVIPFPSLLGQANCRIKSASDKFLQMGGNPTKRLQAKAAPSEADGISLGPEDHLNSTRWTFVPLDAENNSLEMFIVGPTGKALAWDGKSFYFKDIKTMDGIARAQATWKAYVNFTDSQGYSRVMIQSKMSGQHWLAVDRNTGAIKVVQNTGIHIADFSNKMASKSNIVPTHDFEWKVERVF
ncbi:MAG: hypothetical protein KDC43_25870 [Saprospiraceae bacterium]|nr:hypothetical protein [Saprospiraceae bacterium]MCB0678837.1 hypothetical protein [Saprospiraceae bacterium]